MSCSLCNSNINNTTGGRKRVRRTKNKRSRKMRNYRGGGGIMDWFSNAGTTVGDSTAKVEEVLNNVGKSISSTASSSLGNVLNWFSSKPKETTTNTSSSFNPIYSSSPSPPPSSYNTIGGKSSRRKRRNKRNKKTRKM